MKKQVKRYLSFILTVSIMVLSVLPGFASASVVVPVNSITVNSDNSIDMVPLNGTLTMVANILPADATNKGITWSVVNGTGSASIDSNGTLTGESAGQVSVHATSIDGSNVIGNKTINVVVPTIIPVSSITIRGGLNGEIRGGIVTYMTATVLPSNASNTAVTWSVENGTGNAILIDSSAGTLSGTSPGSIKVKATDSSGLVVGSLSMTVVNPPVITVPVTSVSISAPQATVAVGSTLQISGEVLPVTATEKGLIWGILPGTGSATIEQFTGILTGTTPGTVRVKAWSLDAVAQLSSNEITVEVVPAPADIAIQTVFIQPPSPFLIIGQPVQLHPAITPVDATYSEIKWSIVEGESIGTATINADTGEITGLTPGLVKARATIKKNNLVIYISQVSLTVTNKLVESIEISSSNAAPTVNLNGTAQLTAHVMPLDAYNKDVVWSIEQNAGGTGSGTIDSNGLFTGTAVGTVVILATAADGSHVIQGFVITVVKPVSSITASSAGGATSVQEGSTLQISSTVMPIDATNKSVNYTVINGTGSANISRTGLLSAIHPGTVKVKVSTNDGSNVFTELNLVVTAVTSSPDPLPPVGEQHVEEKPVKEKPSVETPANQLPPVQFAPVIKVDEVIASISKKLEENTKTAFSDTTTHWSNQAVEMFSTLGVIDGYGDGQFKPDATISRAEFATIITRVFNLTGSSNVLSDVNGHWASDAIQALASNGIISGYEDGTFKPDKEISRAEIIAMIAKLVVLQSSDSGSSFSDINETWNSDQIKAAADMGLIQGESASTFGPQDNSTRGEALTILLRALELIPELKSLLDSI